VVVTLPHIRSGAEADHLGKAVVTGSPSLFLGLMEAEVEVEIDRPILEVMREERDLNLLAKLPGRGLIELDRTQTVADYTTPAAMVPGPDDHRVHPART